MSKKENRILIVSAFVFLLMVIGIAYAYYADKLNLSNANAQIRIDNAIPTLIAYAEKDLNLNVPIENLSTPSLTPVATDNSNYVVTLSSSEEGLETHCNYDLRIDFSIDRSNENLAFQPKDNYNYEMSLQAQRTTTGDTTGQVYVNKDINEFEVTQLCNTTYCIDRYSILVTGAEIYSNSTTPTETKWNFTLNYYSLPKTQNIVSFNGKISAVNIVCS